MIFKDKKIMEDAPASADERRQAYLDGIGAFLAKLKSTEKEERAKFITPDSLAKNREHYRAEYIKMLGIDKIPAPTKPVECEYYGEDDSLHPSELGYVRIANMVHAELEKQFLHTAD